jgi:hypothetical protein
MKTAIALIALLFALAAGTVVATTSKPVGSVKTPPQGLHCSGSDCFWRARNSRTSAHRSGCSKTVLASVGRGRCQRLNLQSLAMHRGETEERPQVGSARVPEGPRLNFARTERKRRLPENTHPSKAPSEVHPPIHRSTYASLQESTSNARRYARVALTRRLCARSARGWSAHGAG